MLIWTYIPSKKGYASYHASDGSIIYPRSNSKYDLFNSNGFIIRYNNLNLAIQAVENKYISNSKLISKITNWVQTEASREELLAIHDKLSW